jgi:hypothetical protein
MGADRRLGDEARGDGSLTAIVPNGEWLEEWRSKARSY